MTSFSAQEALAGPYSLAISFFAVGGPVASLVTQEADVASLGLFLGPFSRSGPRPSGLFVVDVKSLTHELVVIKLVNGSSAVSAAFKLLLN